MNKILLGCIACLTMMPLFAQDSGSRLLYIKAGALLNTVTGELTNDQAIIVRGDLIERVGPQSEMSAPSGARIIDLSDATVLPGLIDSHVHLTSSASLNGYASLGRSSIRAALYGVATAKKTLEAGFTTVRNVGASDYGDVALRDAIAEGDFPGPRMLVSGPSLGITGGHCDNNLLPSEFGQRSGGVADGPWGVRQKVRQNVKYGADMIKFCATGGVLSKGTTLGARQYTFEEMQALVDEAHTLGLKVAAHAHGTDGIRTAILAGVDSVEHASILDDEVIQLAIDNGTTFVMDVYVSDYILESGPSIGMLEESLAKEREVGQVQRNSFQRAHEAGVNMAFGSDAGVYPHGQNGRQFAFMVQYGMTSLEAIQAATINAAQLLGVGDQVGQIAPGYYADIIAVEGNPLRSVRELESVDFVMKGGQVELELE